MKKIPRILLAAPGSQSGKTLITCGLLQALKNRGIKTASFKCGPDYIDPMFHSHVIGLKSRNLDPFFTDELTMNYLLEKNCHGMELAVMEGVMGYYDGIGGTTDLASTYQAAKQTKTPVILIINMKGMSLSATAWIKGMMEYRRDCNIQGIILNQISPMLYPGMKQVIEEELPVTVFGYVPVQKELAIPSRHLGLYAPEEVGDLQKKLQRLAEMLEKTLDIDGILKIASSAEPIHAKIPVIPVLERNVRVAVAMDEAFSFYYEDSLELLQEMGAQIVPFSPLHDKTLPDASGIWLGGGYPELYAEKLSENCTMRMSVKAAIQNNMPCLAECGGFLYLHEWLETESEDEGGKTDRNRYAMAGVIAATAYPAGRLGRFGYITVQSKVPSVFGAEGISMPAHEFHYWESTDPGQGWHAEKPVTGRSWECIHVRGNLAAGFPHLYFWGNQEAAFSFLKKCAGYLNNN